ncbi:hypothetical protein [Streptomyces sp. NPDC058629]|uniref:hypothetical protein n=1 Tax=Streptomyces sp. NPDC058629 TaxID=3346565 RepID=UPI00364C6BF2
MTTQPERQPLRGELHPAQLLGAEPDMPPSTTETVRGGRRLGTQPERDLRAQVKAALTTARISQAAAARQLDLSTKHMSHMLTGRATLTLDWADRILTLCGMRLAIAAIPDTDQTQPRVSLDDLTSDALDQLHDRADTYRDAWKALRARWWKANARIDELDARVRELEAEVDRLTAGQCTHTRAMCEQHHAVPVAGCPYPRCVAAQQRDQRAPVAPGEPKSCCGGRIGHYPGCPTQAATIEEPA